MKYQIEVLESMPPHIKAAGGFVAVPTVPPKIHIVILNDQEAMPCVFQAPLLCDLPECSILRFTTLDQAQG